MISLGSSTNSKGFTLVELLIVVIILAILAAIIVPQFSAATDDADQAAYNTNIANIRAAVDLYKQQHGEYPGAVTSTGVGCPGTSANKPGAADDEAAFLAQLQYYTNSAGVACTGTDTTFKYGPYLKDEMPVNPLGDPGIATVDVIALGILDLTSGGSGGWKFDTITGEFIGDE